MRRKVCNTGDSGAAAVTWTLCRGASRSHLLCKSPDNRPLRRLLHHHVTGEHVGGSEGATDSCSGRGGSSCGGRRDGSCCGGRRGSICSRTTGRVILTVPDASQRSCSQAWLL